MKDKKQKISFDKRYLLLLVAGFLTGRVWLYGINPFGVALFAAVAAERKGRKLLALFVLAGMFSSTEGLSLIKYLTLFLLVLSLEKIQEKWTSHTGQAVYLALLTGGLNMAAGILNSILAVNTWEVFWLSILESVMVFALANVYQWGVHFILYEEWNQLFNNEELISLLILAVTALYGLPRQADMIFSISGTLSYFMILFMGYRYGASTGAIAGAAGGILLALTGENMVVVGICCLLGVCAGTLRKMGRFVSGGLYLLVGVLLAVYSLKDLYGIIELRAMLSAVILFFAIPRRVIHCVEEDIPEREEDSFAKEDVRALANHQLEDFSDAFRRLSKSFENEMEEKGLSEERLEDIFAQLSRDTCNECINCKYCWNRHYEETNESLRQILWQVGQDGSVTMSQISPDFQRRCMHLDEYVHQVEERIAGENVRLGWHNRMSENRRVMAEQMKEIAVALKSFTINLGETEELPKERKRRILEELKKEVYEANMLLPHYGLVTFTWGNVSGIDREKGLFVIKPSGVDYEKLTPEDMVVVDLNGNKIEGDLNPSSDTATHVVLYNRFPKIGGVVHTHSPWATSWAQAGRGIPCYGTTHADYLYGEVPCVRNLTKEEIDEAYEKNTGVLIADEFAIQNLDYIATPAVLCKNHGPFTWGKDAQEAVHNAVVLEEVAKMAARAELINPQIKPAPQELQDKHYYRKHGANAYYGQPGR